MVCRARFLAFARGLPRSRSSNQLSDFRAKSFLNENLGKSLETTLAMDRVGRTIRVKGVGFWVSGLRVAYSRIEVCSP